MLLNGTPFAFVIDLAALASRREYLKLDKWLTDKIREHGVSVHSYLHYCSKVWDRKGFKKIHFLRSPWLHLFDIQ